MFHVEHCLKPQQMWHGAKRVRICWVRRGFALLPLDQLEALDTINSIFAPGYRWSSDHE
jgi:hypothetical protein